MKYEIKYLEPGSLVFSALPVVLFILGVIGGIMAFIVLPNPMIQPMTMTGKLLAAGIFAVVYMLLVLAFVIICALVYNFFCAGLGFRGIRLRIDGVEDEEVPEPAQEEQA